jgi:hypothetical protein
MPMVRKHKRNITKTVSKWYFFQTKKMESLIGKRIQINTLTDGRDGKVIREIVYVKFGDGTIEKFNRDDIKLSGD